MLSVTPLTVSSPDSSLSTADTIRYRIAAARDLLNAALEDAAIEGVAVTVNLVQWNPVGSEQLPLVQLDVQPFLTPEEATAAQRRPAHQNLVGRKDH